LAALSLGFGCAQGVSAGPSESEDDPGEFDVAATQGAAGEGAEAEDAPLPDMDAEEVPVPATGGTLLPGMDGALEPAADDAECEPVVVGPNFAKTVINDTTSGTLGWLTPEVVAGDTDLSASYAGLAESNYLFARDFGLAIPDGARIRGIVVEWQRKALGAGIKDAEVSIVRNGAIGADNHARPEDWPTAANPMWGTYGMGGPEAGASPEPSDLWGEDWTAEDINGEGFGVALRVLAGPAFVSRVRVSVRYCP
jgi:hypothetical protein